jgi:hypothetical protein
LPKSKTKKAGTGTSLPKKRGKPGTEDDDLGLDEILRRWTYSTTALSTMMRRIFNSPFIRLPDQ